MPEVDCVAVILEAFLFLPHEILVTVNRDGFLYQLTALWTLSVPPQERRLKCLTTLSFPKCHRPQHLHRPHRRSCCWPVYRSDCLRPSWCERCSWVYALRRNSLRLHFIMNPWIYSQPLVWGGATSTSFWEEIPTEQMSSIFCFEVFLHFYDKMAKTHCAGESYVPIMCLLRYFWPHNDKIDDHLHLVQY